MKFSAAQLAAVLQGTIEGDASVCVHDYAKIEEGKPGTLSFLSNPKYEPFIYETEASIVLVNNDFVPSKPVKATLIRVPNAYLALATLLQLAEQNKPAKTGIDPTAQIAQSATIGNNCYIGPFVYIGENAVIGDNTQIYSHCAINEHATVGNNTILYNQVTVYHHCQVGNDCILHAGCVIGADGFGFAKNPDGSYFKMPQNGNVIIEDNVEIGANTCIDRGSMGPTIIRKGVKLDNQIQIGHNVEVDQNTAMAGCSAIAGSTKVGKDCIVAGLVGIAGHLHIADNTVIGAFSGVTKSISKPGQTYHGALAIPALQNKKAFAVYRNLPDLSKELHNLKKEVEALKAQLNQK
ncbi:MAG: UDP-3-O-(3-hydroxymyristoyl)glucosamine N-acyltransferase [Paludibacteraceae bacterium]|nr:UDP-3-O-(3-hydroxymyristoyl)glucosamine N-acyltransferase [Paludibacteraceae bacterium]